MSQLLEKEHDFHRWGAEAHSGYPGAGDGTRAPLTPPTQRHNVHAESGVCDLTGDRLEDSRGQPAGRRVARRGRRLDATGSFETRTQAEGE